MDADGDRWGLAPDRHRDYLLLLGRAQLDPGLRGLLDPSDAVQQALLKTHRSWALFRGRTGEEMAAWLRAILARQLADLVRRQNGA